MFGLITKKFLEDYGSRWDRQFSKLLNASDAAMNKIKEHILSQVKIQARSNQFKHNDHERRIVAMESILEHKLKKWHENNEKKEVAAAEDAEKTYGKADLKDVRQVNDPPA